MTKEKERGATRPDPDKGLWPGVCADWGRALLLGLRGGPSLRWGGGKKKDNCSEHPEELEVSGPPVVKEEFGIKGKIALEGCKGRPVCARPKTMPVLGGEEKEKPRFHQRKELSFRPSVYGRGGF